MVPDGDDVGLDGVIRGLGQKYTLNSVLDDVLQQMGLQGQIHIGIPIPASAGQTAHCELMCPALRGSL